MFFIKSRGTHISEHKGHKELSLGNSLFDFLNPEFVYIPLIEQNTPCDVLVKVGDKVKLGQVIAMKTGRFASPIHASVSGEVVSVSQKMWHASGKMVPTIQIKNDFQETKADSIKPNDVNALSKEQIIEIVKNCGVVGLGGSGFPAYAKYQVKQDMDVVIVNAVECEPYITADYTLLKEHLEEVLRGASYIMKTVGAKQAVIAIKENKQVLIEKIRYAIENRPEFRIELLKDEYPAGWEKYIVQRVTGKDYKALPSEVGAVLNNAATCAAVCQAVEDNMPLVEKTITVTGEGIRSPRNVRTKIGANIHEIIEKIGGYAEGLEDAYFIAGGPMTGKAIMFDTMVVHRSLSSVVVMPKNIREINPECMGCGKCGEVCPVFLSPILIKEALEANDLEKMKEFKANLCMQCGLCSYICPSRIELTDAVARAKAKVLQAK